MARNLSTEKFREAACKVKLSIRVLKNMHFHTTRTVARAIDTQHGTVKKVGTAPQCGRLWHAITYLHSKICVLFYIVVHQTSV